MLPIHKTSFLLCLLPQMARRHLGLYARCGTYHTAPNDLSLGVPAAVEAVPVVEAQTAEVLLLAGCLHDHPPAAARQPIYQSGYHVLLGRKNMPASVSNTTMHECRLCVSAGNTA